MSVLPIEAHADGVEPCRKRSRCGGPVSQKAQLVGFQMQVEMLDGGVEKVGKSWNPNVGVEFQVWMGWKTDIQVGTWSR